MKWIGSFVFLLFLGTPLFSQTLPEFELNKSDVEFQMRFLASDELKGRATGSDGINIAARFIAEQLRIYGCQYAPGLDSYYQPIRMAGTQPPDKGFIQVGESKYVNKDQALLLAGKAVDFSAPAVFAGHGWIAEDGSHNDYQGLDVKGKIVVLLPGTPESSNPRTVFRSRNQKIKIAADQGAVAVIELFRLQFPWAFFLRFNNRENLRVLDPKQEPIADIPYALLKENEQDLVQILKDKPGTALHIFSTGIQKRSIDSKNIIGIVEGSDPILKEEYILLTAHYDHVGTRTNNGEVETVDSIFNGARDNALGTIALLAAAKSLAQKPAKRSVIFLMVTGEEMGLLGSAYYANNPLIPLKQTIFNLNSDNAGYNDTTLVSVIGHGRTGTDEVIKKGVEAIGLKLYPNPAPEQGLFDRSDNVSFAQKGVPCVTVSAGFTSFDDEINKYYHKAADDPDSINYDYLLKFSKAMAHITRLLADSETRPKWKEGDKYEEVSKELYNK